MNKNFDTDLTVDGDTSDWTKDVYDEWDERNSFSRAAHTRAEELIESGVSEDNIEVVRIDNKNRLIFEVTDREVNIVQCGGHYNDK